MMNYFVQLRATGCDRSRFLHNFCTNNIKAMEPGMACEAFFTDVKARVLAHGYILAFDDRQEIWIRPGDSDLLLKHLNRYIISEDVVIVGDASASSLAQKSTVCLPVSDELWRQLPAHNLSVPDKALKEFSDQPRAVQSVEPNGDSALTVSGLIVAWAQEGLLILQGPEPVLHQLTTTMHKAGIDPLTMNQIELLRIEERFPVIGLDMTNEHLAPEAERNAKAICYTKGCYLGQEPIARLDAMGHINRGLRAIEITGQCSADQLIGCVLKGSDGQAVGTVTSAVNAVPGRNLALSMVKLSVSKGDLHLVTPSGQILLAQVLPIEAVAD